RPESRGISGHSMGGNGALKIAMQNPDIFGSVYALSPSVLGWGKEFTLEHPSFKSIAEAKSLKDIQNDFYSMVLVAMASTYTYNIDAGPFHGNLPVTFRNGEKHIDSVTMKIWESKFPLNMLDSHIENIKQLKGIAVDWGAQDDFPHIPYTCHEFSKRLKQANITHLAEEYQGMHGDKIGGKDGRINTKFISFFKDNLENSN
ncbi:MAG: alpha/beta hydrolase-fold protein, partial [Bacteroidia bacterium]